jgi:hypothetical protein
MMAIILLNSIILGAEVNETAIKGNSGYVEEEDQNPLWWYTEVLFSVIYVFEVAAKTNVDGWKFFEDFWNIFDYLIVSSTTSSLFYQLFANEAEKRGSGKVIAVLRVGRLLRLGRILKVVKGLRTLKYLYNGMFRAVPPIMYMFGFLFFPLYFIASNSYCQLLPINHPSPTRWVYFRSVPAGQFTWFEMTTGEARGVMRGILQYREDPVDLDGTVVRPRGEEYDVATDRGNQALLIFICGVVIMYCRYAVLSTVTGLVISRVAHLTDEWRERKLQEDWAQEEAHMNSLGGLFKEGDTDGDGRLTMAEFEATLLSDKLSLALARNIGVYKTDLIELFSMLRQLGIDDEVFVRRRTDVLGLVMPFPNS